MAMTMLQRNKINEEIKQKWKKKKSLKKNLAANIVNIMWITENKLFNILIIS